MTEQRLVEGRAIAAVAEDAISGLLPGTSTAKVLGSTLIDRLFPWTKAEYYLNEDAAWSVARYHEEHHALLRFFEARQKLLIPQVLVVDNTASTLDPALVKFRVLQDAFRIDPALNGRSAATFSKYRWFLRLRRRAYYNGQLLRLASLSVRRSDALLTVQPVRYEATCRMHLCLDAKVHGSSESIRDIVHPGGALEPLETSRLPNTLGINCLFLTADGRAVLPMRTARVVVRPNQLSPTSSGDCEYSDAQEGGTLASMPRLREAFEELGLEWKHLDKDSLRFLGLTRELVRGGKPEMFFVGNTTLTQNEMQRLHGDAIHRHEYSRRYSQWVFWDFGSEAVSPRLNANGQYVLRSAFEDLMRDHAHAISVPLLTNLVLWLKSKGIFPDFE